MPMIEYECEYCERRFEIYYGHGEQVQDKCMCYECGLKSAHKVPSLSNFSLKGGGWEKDGYQKGSSH